MSLVKKAFESSKIVPDVIPTPPTANIEVSRNSKLLETKRPQIQHEFFYRRITCMRISYRYIVKFASIASILNALGRLTNPVSASNIQIKDFVSIPAVGHLEGRWRLSPICHLGTC